MWGTADFAPDDLENTTQSHGSLIAFRQNSPAVQSDSSLYNMTSNGAGTWILEHTQTDFQVRVNLYKICNNCWGCSQGGYRLQSGWLSADWARE